MPTSTLTKQWVELPILDGKMETYVVKPAGKGPWPAVIVLMEIFGVNAHIQDVTERLATEGYVALAPNYYHRNTQNLTLDYTETNIAVGRELKAKTTREGILTDLRACIEFLQQDPDVQPKSKIGCIGFCFGGHIAYIAAGFSEIAASASFYGAGIAVTSPGNGPATISHTSEIKGEILCFFGEKDSSIPHEQTVAIDHALTEAHVPHKIVRYTQAGHGFFCNQRADFDASAADDAWHRTLMLFQRRLKETT